MPVPAMSIIRTSMQHKLNDPDGSASQNVTVHVINVCTGQSLRSLPMRGQWGD